MKKTALTGITTILPFDTDYIKVGKDKDTKWNLMDKDGKLISTTWFQSVERNRDGSISTTVIEEKSHKVAPVKFIDVVAMRSFSDVVAIMPPIVMNLVDTGSIKPCDDGRYVATASFYGMKVYITKEGHIYDTNGVKLRILFNTVDTERLNNCLNKLNKKLNFDFDGNEKSFSWSDTIKSKEAIFAFYWVTDDCSVDLGRNTPMTHIRNPKWSDDLKIRADQLMPENIRNSLSKTWNKTPEFMDGSGYSAWTWTFKKEQLEEIISALEAI